MSHNEAKWRVKGCVSGDVATAVLLFGAKKQLVLFPERFSVVWELCGGRGVEEGGGEGKGMARHKEGEEASGKKCRKREVGGVLGSVFGYESSGDESTSDPHRQFTNGRWSVTEEVRDGLVHAEPASCDSHPASGDGNGRRSGVGCPGLVEQVNTSFQNWCERMGDGSLKRCGVEVWPEWTHS